MDYCIDSLGKTAIFYTIDTSGGYLQDEKDEADRDKTVFTFHYELYRLIRMPFGLHNALETFQRTVGVKLSALKWQLTPIYLDHIVILPKSLQEHISRVQIVVALLCKAGDTLKFKSC